MRVVVDSIRMREADRLTIEMLNSNGIILMEHAGTACVRELEKEFGRRLIEKKVLCIAGKGNNGGDAIVVARQLKSKGVNVKLILLAKPDDYKGDARFQLEIIRNYPVEIEVIDKDRSDGLEVFRKNLSESDIVVDGIFGTGLSKPVEGFYRKIIDAINNDFNGFVLSVDIPSGLFADKSTDIYSHIKANLTVTFGKIKPCHVLYPASKSCGRVVEDWITIPDFVFEKVGEYFYLIGKDDIKPLKKDFPPDSHKGTFGHAGIISGEKGKLGASILASFAALKSGCGLSTVYIEESDYPFVSSFYPEVMFYLAKVKNSDDFLTEFLNTKSAVLIGQGLGVGEYQKSLVKKVIKLFDKPIVFDADVFKNFTVDEFAEYTKGKEIVLTPHPGEMSSFTGYSTKEIQENRIEVAKEVSLKTGAVVVLKGYQTVIANREKVFVNTTGTSALGTAGSGDVLGGIITSLICQGYSLINAVLLGVISHGLAGEIAENAEGREGVTAGSLIDKISKALNYGIE
ncbi:ADP-dependent NAD(P)H-hydrate dehydratase / NAD(P)H-hydrate epimerase [Thermotomaculum hydrothermale]|uniref:Bifunctional NAD(P)H-hydrate repair enzyme n=1 Tax=Thermotomaculum hydrothermale TaxID=981385 RepID=A0A7R6SYA0_9BACT|nr:NAD(P)H-hydrate dehydratase [Thermotomaculum hydrothermale]BBB32410.1 ADP-dependent NAD(P)H-hydrate dehydratase / NAD(P)H-hydrate epimerase [Thermotomaculum hydrothermale]